MKHMMSGPPVCRGRGHEKLYSHNENRVPSSDFYVRNLEVDFLGIREGGVKKLPPYDDNRAQPPYVRVVKIPTFQWLRIQLVMKDNRGGNL